MPSRNRLELAELTSGQNIHLVMGRGISTEDYRLDILRAGAEPTADIISVSADRAVERLLGRGALAGTAHKMEHADLDDPERRVRTLTLSMGKGALTAGGLLAVRFKVNGGYSVIGSEIQEVTVLS